MSMRKPITFEPPDYLDSEEMIAEYTAQALASGDAELFLSAMSDVAKARSKANSREVQEHEQSQSQA